VKLLPVYGLLILDGIELRERKRRMNSLEQCPNVEATKTRYGAIYIAKKYVFFIYFLFIAVSHK